MEKNCVFKAISNKMFQPLNAVNKDETQNGSAYRKVLLLGAVQSGINFQFLRALYNWNLTTLSVQTFSSRKFCDFCKFWPFLPKFMLLKILNRPIRESL